LRAWQSRLRCWMTAIWVFSIPAKLPMDKTKNLLKRQFPLPPMPGQREPTAHAWPRDAKAFGDLWNVNS